jgi:hypothetical protein
MTAEERTDLGTPKQVIVAGQLDGNGRGDGDNAWESLRREEADVALRLLLIWEKS